MKKPLEYVPVRQLDGLFLDLKQNCDHVQSLSMHKNKTGRFKHTVRFLCIVM